MSPSMPPKKTKEDDRNEFVAQISPSMALKKAAEVRDEDAAEIFEDEEKNEYADLAEDDEDIDLHPDYCPGLAVQLGYGGLIAVLLETPSGFAIFIYDGVKLLRPRATEHLWTEFVEDSWAQRIVSLKEFQIFEDKASAINADTGVHMRLAEMIKRCVKPKQKLAVGSFEYKKIIEGNLKISCMHDEAVMELMWGLRNCMHSLVPEELTKGDRPLMCKGMRTVLEKYHFDYKPEMVNDALILVISLVYNCDFCVDKHFVTLHAAGKVLYKISKINCEGWDLLKLVTALKWVCYPNEELSADLAEILSEDKRSRLMEDAPKYKDKLWGEAILVTYHEIVEARAVRDKWLKRLPRYLKDAEEECKAEQAMSRADPGVHSASYQPAIQAI